MTYSQVYGPMQDQLALWFERQARSDYRRWQRLAPDLAEISYERFAASCSGSALRRWFEDDSSLDDLVQAALITLGRTEEMAALLVICAQPLTLRSVERPTHAYSVIHNTKRTYTKAVRIAFGHDIRRQVRIHETTLSYVGSKYHADFVSLDGSETDSAVDVVSAPDDNDVVARHLLGQMLAEVMHDADRTTVLLAMAVFYDGEQISDVAAALGLPYKTAQKRIYRLRKALADHASLTGVLAYRPAKSDVDAPASRRSTQPIRTAAPSPDALAAQKTKACTFAGFVPKPAAPLQGVNQ